MAPRKPARKSGKASGKSKSASRSIPMKTITPLPMNKMDGESCCSTNGCCGGEGNCCCGNCGGGFCHILALFGCVSTWIMAVVAGVTLWVFDFLWHGMLLMPRYLETAIIWRPEADMANLWPYCIAYHALYGLVFTASFKLMHSKGFMKGGKNGVLIAAPLAISTLMVYVTNSAIPVDILQMWAAGDLLQGAVTGLVLAGLCCWLGKGCKGSSCC